MKQRLLWMQAITPVHNGAGQGLGSIDRPIIREAATNYPYVQSSTIKGALRPRALEAIRREYETQNKSDQPDKDERFLAAFGVGETTGNQGCLVFNDAQLVLLPVRSLVGTCVWVTCGVALARLRRVCHLAGTAKQELEALDKLLRSLPEKRGFAVGVGEHDRVIRIGKANAYCVEGLVLRSDHQEEAAHHCAEVAEWLVQRAYEEDSFDARFVKPRILCLAEDDFADLVARAMHIEANIRIGESGVTDIGSLRYTEFLPAATLMVSLVTVLPPLRKPPEGVQAAEEGEIEQLLEKTATGYLQLGADESKGKGLVRVDIAPDATAGPTPATNGGRT